MQDKKTATGRFTEDQAKRVIPNGCYCYDNNGTCPFWDKIKDRPHQESGYCHWLQVGDFDINGTMLLWDQCKECGLNEGGDETS